MKLGRRGMFQHDNDPKHTAKNHGRISEKEKGGTMTWPSMSPEWQKTLVSFMLRRT